MKQSYECHLDLVLVPGYLPYVTALFVNGPDDLGCFRISVTLTVLYIQMESNQIFKFLFFMQSAAFAYFIFNYAQRSNIVKTSPQAASYCECQRNASAAKPQINVSAVYHTATSTAPIVVKIPAHKRLSNCSLVDIKQRAGVMLLTTTNLAFLDVTVNMFESIKRIGICVNTTIIAEDKKSYQFLLKRTANEPGMHVAMTGSGEVDTGEMAKKGGRAYYAFLRKRQGYILTLLEQGWEVLFTDADTFWFRDPFPFFKGEFDLSMIDSANPFGVRNSRSNFCSGFVYFKPTKAAIQFVKEWIVAAKKMGIMDQVVMNRLLKADKPVHINVKPLDTNIFPWGPKFYNLLAKKANYSTVVMHAASVRGHTAKVAKFKSSNMWLVNATSTELLAQDL